METKKVTIIICSDDCYVYYLGIDLETGTEVFRCDYPTYGEYADDDKYIKHICEMFNVEEKKRISWLSTR